MRATLFARPSGLPIVRLGLTLAAAIVVSLLLGSTSAFAAAHSEIGKFGTFINPNGIAVDESSGDVYVADLGVSEQQAVSVEGGPTGGSFTLELEGQKTSLLSVGESSPTAGEVEVALQALTSIGTGNVSVSEEGALPGTVTYTVSFQGALATRNVPSLACDGAALTGGTTPKCAVATKTSGVEGKVYKFDAQGSPVEFSALSSNALTGAGTPGKSFSFPTGAYGTPAAIAVDSSKSPLDPSAGDLYVMDAGHGVIDKFSPTGEYVSQIAGFAPATGFVENELLGFAVDAAGTVRADLSSGPGDIAFDEFDDAFTNVLVATQRNGTIGREKYGGIMNVFQEADGAAVGPTGDDYLLYRSCSCVAKVGQQLAGLGQVDKSQSGDVALATDPATGHLYAENQSSVTEWDSGAVNGSLPLPHTSPVEFESSGVRVGEPFGSLSGSSGQGGIAVNGSTGDIYVASPSEGEVKVFGRDAPAVTAGAASGVTKEAATLNGTVDPRGASLSSCRFEYGVADKFGRADYEHTVSCEASGGVIGSGTSPVAVSAQISGLNAGLLYRFRLVATNASASGETSGLLASARVGFGVKHFEVSFVNQDGSPDTQAGSHPYAMTNTIEFNSHFQRAEPYADSAYVQEPDGTLKDLTVDLPPGLVGDPNATARKCTLAELLNQSGNGVPLCPSESELGHLALSYNEFDYYGTYEFNEPIFNVVPPHGVALELGVHYRLPDLFISNGVLAGGDYPVQARIVNAPPTAPVLTSKLTISGVVGKGGNRKAFLTLPTGCHGPLHSSISIDSYEGQTAEKSEVTRNSAGAPVSLTGCSKLQFPPTISVRPDTSDASSSSGLTVGVHVPQTAAKNPDGLAESSLRDTTVTLPEGVALNPSGGDGLQACSESLAGFTGFSEFNSEFEPGVKTATFTPTMPQPLQPGANFCPDGSKVGTVKLKTPLLEHELEGAVYLASQNQNPFGSLVAMYMVIEDPFSGSIVKLAGEVHLTETGQIVTRFNNTPDLPFEDLELHFFGGERAPLTTPAHCGVYTTTAVFVPWDGDQPVTSTSSFNIEHGPSGGPCPGAALPFNPSLSGGTTNINAGSFSSLTTTISREDGQQNMQSVQLHTPPGLSGMLSGVKLCSEAQANEGTCSLESLIGETTVSAGVGSDPVTVQGGKVYITEKYAGAPFGLSIVNPVKAGPFDLEHDTSNPAQSPACDCLVVRAKIEVDPISAALTVTTDPSGAHAIPHLIDGIPVQIKHVNVTINRQGFTFNPTNCKPMSITARLDSAEGATAALSVPFQVTNCARLSFKPRFSVSTSGKTSRAKGASLHVKLAYPKLPFGSQANIAKVKVDLPKRLPSRLTTLQKACVDRVFNANPAGCPAASKVGSAVATTPILPVPLRGPAYFVSHGGAKFPELIVVLQGYGVIVDLHSETFISKAGITSSTFREIPDVPVGTFELTLPQGPYSALAANRNLCQVTRTVVRKKSMLRVVKGRKRRVTSKVKSKAGSLVMPTVFTAQNGAVIHENTPIAVTGCGKATKRH